MKKILALALCAPTLAFAEPVTLDTLVRAESDHMIRTNMKAFDFGVGEVRHLRELTPLDNQSIIRMNEDTLYSGLVLDLSEPVEITLPEIGGRYQSMLVINQDHYLYAEAQPGTYTLTEDAVGTRFAFIGFRTFVDANDPDDIEATRAAQDGITITGGGDGPFEAPNWDLDTLAAARKSLNDLASTLGYDTRLAYGGKDEVRPIEHMVGAIAGWAGLPPQAAVYVVESVAENDGKTHHAVTVKDVPVDAFWSVTVYNSDGFLEPNDLGVNSYNNVSAQPNYDGSYTLHFGGCEDGRMNCIPVTQGWNYTIRLYEPRAEILDGSWTFPAFEPVD